MQYKITRRSYLSSYARLRSVYPQPNIYLFLGNTALTTLHLRFLVIRTRTAFTLSSFKTLLRKGKIQLYGFRFSGNIEVQPNYLCACTCPFIASQAFLLRINTVSSMIQASPIKTNIFIMLAFWITLQQTLLRYHKQQSTLKSTIHQGNGKNVIIMLSVY